MVLWLFDLFYFILFILSAYNYVWIGFDNDGTHHHHTRHFRLWKTKLDF